MDFFPRGDGLGGHRRPRPAPDFFAGSSVRRGKRGFYPQNSSKRVYACGAPTNSPKCWIPSVEKKETNRRFSVSPLGERQREHGFDAAISRVRAYAILSRGPPSWVRTRDFRGSNRLGKDLSSVNPIIFPGDRTRRDHHRPATSFPVSDGRGEGFWSWLEPLEPRHSVSVVDLQ